MSAKSRTRPTDSREVQLRAGHAVEFLETATEALTLHPERTNVAVSNAVLAGIAAADAICGHRLGEAAKGEAHAEAVRLLAQAGADLQQPVGDLRRLLGLKTDSQYSPLVLTERTATDAIRPAGEAIRHDPLLPAGRLDVLGRDAAVGGEHQVVDDALRQLPLADDDELLQLHQLIGPPVPSDPPAG